jgi:hypothetical protein
MFKKHEDWVEALVVVPGSAAAQRAAVEALDAGFQVDAAMDQVRNRGRNQGFKNP